jgi:malonyl CoA-acyl carrier protein transacylase
MTARIVCVFPGQGAQFVGMGKDLYEADADVRALYDQANSVLDYDLRRLCFEGPEEDLRLTRNTQPAILVHSVAIWTVLRKRQFQPALLAGHSLGEYTALVATGALAFADAVRLVHRRGAFMQEAVPPGEGSMAALIGMERQTVEALCAECAKGSVLQPANLNAPDQIVIAGATTRVKTAVEAVKKRRLGSRTGCGTVWTVCHTSHHQCDRQAVPLAARGTRPARAAGVRRRTLGGVDAVRRRRRMRYAGGGWAGDGAIGYDAAYRAGRARPGARRASPGVD